MEHFIDFAFTKLKPLINCRIPREGVIIVCPLIHLFHDALDVILTSRNNVRQLDDDDDEPTLGIYININIMLKVVKMTIYNVFDIPKC